MRTTNEAWLELHRYTTEKAQMGLLEICFVYPRNISLRGECGGGVEFTALAGTYYNVLKDELLRIIGDVPHIFEIGQLGAKKSVSLKDFTRVSCPANSEHITLYCEILFQSREPV